MIETFKDFKVRNRGCVMMKLDIPSWDNICSLIAPEDVYSPDEDHGIEHNPHITILFGFYSFVATNDVLNILRKFPSPKATFGKIGIFEDHPDFDIAMIKVDSEDLVKMNIALSNLPCERTFPTFKPHVTIAYLNKGTAKKYEGMEVDFPEELVLTEAIYSMPNGAKISFELK